VWAWVLSFFAGRISRQQFWRGLLGIWILLLVTRTLVVLAFWLFALATSAPLDAWSTSPVLRLGSALVGLLAVLLFLVIAVKRRHDRGKSGIECFVACGLVALMLLSAGVGPEGIAVTGGEILVPGWPAIVVRVITQICILVLLIPLGLLKGTSGPNRYGPDPLAPSGPVHTTGDTG